ncbi:hypothetical protein [Archangium violaceum]|uniref:hypothetical protein n=1 Tax=Archangium violaceum TaxID=83451 RepID=UPI0036DAA3A8
MVVAYHGCDLSVAERLLTGESFKLSQNTYDWLGDGIYFWEYGADRALQFAQEQVARGRVQTPACVGALIQLGKCFDLLDTRFTRELAAAYEPWSKRYSSEALPLPRNTGQAPDFKLRLLDRSVVNWYLRLSDRRGDRFDTVRCGFPEGGPIYPGSGILEQTHIQLTVRNPGCILGVFRLNAETV